MIQDIFPSKLDNSYVNAKPEENDILLFFNREGKILLGSREKGIDFPAVSGSEGRKAVYLFSLDDTRYFLDLENEDHREPDTVRSREAASYGIGSGRILSDNKLCLSEEDGFEYCTIREVRDRFEGKEVFAVFTAYHLWKWYSDNIFCGRCGHKLVPDEKERALRCPECQNLIYPRINPAVIVGVIKGDRLLITRYRRGYGGNALVAGFTEIGETLEETVAREVMEETGVRVKNIRYYKSQPWGMAQDILVGYYCDADGDGEITMDADELKYAEWVKREDIELQPNNLSLTNEMMRMFKEGAAVTS